MMGKRPEIDVRHGDCLDVLRTLPDHSIDSCVTDPPYALVSIVKRFGGKNAKESKSDGASGVYQRAGRGFMGKTWDTGERAFCEKFWSEVLRVLKPGAHLFAFSGTRTYHRLACAIEDSGFDIRDQFAWAYKSGFPKNHNISKAIDKHLGCERSKVKIPGDKTRNPRSTGLDIGTDRPWLRAAELLGYHEAVSDEAVSDEAVSWQGWGTAAKPSWEPICLARAPLIGSIAANVLEYGTGAINIDGTRIGTRIGTRTVSTGEIVSSNVAMVGANYGRVAVGETVGRWPANIITDDSEEVSLALSEFDRDNRIFYCAKADAEDRCGSKHPTVKPIDLMAYLIRMITPPGGTVLDPFAGSGTTGMACLSEGFSAILIERESEYVEDIKRRIAHVSGGGTPLFGGDGTDVAVVRKVYGKSTESLRKVYGKSTESSRTTNRTNGAEEVKS